MADVRSPARGGTALLLVFLIVQTAVLLLSVTGVDPGFWPRTTLTRLHQHPAVNALLVATLSAAVIALWLTRAERRAAGLMFSGLLAGIGLVCALVFDVGLFVAYLLAAWWLYHANRPGATEP